MTYICCHSDIEAMSMYPRIPPMMKVAMVTKEE